MGGLDTYRDAALEGRVARPDALAWSSEALLSGVLDGHRCSLAPAIGNGFSEDRGHVAPIVNPHGFSVEWLRIEPGSAVGVHRHSDSQVLLLVEGNLEVVVNRDADSLRSRPAAGSVVSIPEDAWRNFVNVGDTDVLCAIVCGGDAPTRIVWDPLIESASAAAGWRRDASGHLAPIELLGHPNGQGQL